jgi:hypothetical protein
MFDILRIMFTIFIGVLIFPMLILGNEVIVISEQPQKVSIENPYVKIEYDLSDGTYKGINKSNNSTCILDAHSEINGLDPARFRDYTIISSKGDNVDRSWSSAEINDKIGSGKRLIIKCKKEDNITLILEITLYQDKSFVVLNTGIHNLAPFHIRINNMHPLIGIAYRGYDINKNYYILDGTGGAQDTKVTSSDHLKSRNNILVTFGGKKSKKSLVIGGLTYQDFEKFVEIYKEISGSHIKIDIWSQDPIGKLVDAKTKYIPDDRYYLDFYTNNPFEALENYGFAVRNAQWISLNYYTFPTLCLYYSGHKKYYGGPPNNDTPGAVWEMKQARKRGFLKYSKVAIRLVPGGHRINNPQGWWDDEHWQMHGDGPSRPGPFYKPPYETTEKWAQAILNLGGIPLTYFQTNRRSEDYALKHPGHMLFNSPLHPKKGESMPQFKWDGSEMVGYDFTDPGFINHMKNVYRNLKSGGVKGLMFDYPYTGWIETEGGFEDKYATTASAYRNIFKLAYEGLGEESYIQERDNARGSDVSLGLITSERASRDTDIITPELITRCGLRWYKNRVVVNYDMDAKNPFHCKPDNLDGIRSMFTMAYVVSGRLLLGCSFSKMTDEMIHTLSRVYPFHSEPKSARPIDAFSGKEFPQVYDFEVNSSWHQLTFYNTCQDSTGIPIPTKVSVKLSEDPSWGGLGLDAKSKYYVYDFWNDCLVGIILGEKSLTQELRPGEARMMSIHKVQNRPQLLSTNRHIMQGYVDIVNMDWNEEQVKLTGSSKVVGGEPYKVVIATNGYILKGSIVSQGSSEVEMVDFEKGLAELTILNKKNDTVDWYVTFSER